MDRKEKSKHLPDVQDRIKVTQHQESTFAANNSFRDRVDVSESIAFLPVH